MKKKIWFVFAVLCVMLCVFNLCIAQEDGPRIKDQVSKSIVRIYLDGSVGTGFFVSDKYIVTNHHVVSPYLEDGYVGGKGWFTLATNTKVDVIFSAVNNDIIGGLVVQDWPEVDLAVVEIDPAYSKRVPLKLSPGEQVVEGMNVWVIGFPGVNSYDIMSGDNPTITSGILSKISHDAIGQNSTPFLKLSYDSITNPGNSGGPVVDRYGNVVGIHNSGSTEGIAFFGIHVDELIKRLNAAGIPCDLAGSVKEPQEVSPTPTPKPNPVIDNTIIWIVIGVLGAGVIGLLIYLMRAKSIKPSPKPSPKPIQPEPSSKASIQGLSGQFSGQKKPLSTGKDTVIGKDPSVCTIRFDENEKNVSRKHCRIHFSNTNQCFVIQDLGSTNGTILVRGSSQTKVPSKSSLKLKDGDLIYVPNKNNTFRINL